MDGADRPFPESGDRMPPVPLHDHDLVGRWARVPADQPATPILIGVADAATRINVSASLVAAGCHIVIARTAPRATAMLRAVDVVVADARFLGALRPAAQELLRATPVVALIGAGEPLPELPAWLATVVLRAPFDVEDLVRIVMHVARWSR
jgi:hypothetical protein